MTLAEVLLGVLALTLVAALAYSLTLTARRLFDRQTDWAEGLGPVSEGLDVLIQDLACSLVPVEGEAPFFLLTAGAAGSELTCVTAAPPEPGDPELPLSRFRVLRVSWRLERGTAGGDALVRTTRPERSDSEPGEKRSRLTGVASFEVRVYDPAKRDWVEAWLTGPAGALPAAARVTLTVKTGRGAETLSADTVIPAGLRIAGP
jgi:hypothetical protein